MNYLEIIGGWAIKLSVLAYTFLTVTPSSLEGPEIQFMTNIVTKIGEAGLVVSILAFIIYYLHKQLTTEKTENKELMKKQIELIDNYNKLDDKLVDLIVDIKTMLVKLDKDK